MQLVEKGEVRLNDPVAKYIPEFEQNGKEDITVRGLLTHYSGLEPDLDLTHPWQGRNTAFGMAFAEKPVNPPGSRFVYSDINFITLGALVERVSTIELHCYRSAPSGTPDSPELRSGLSPRDRRTSFSLPMLCILAGREVQWRS